LLHAEAVAAGERVSLATVYNTLHQFKRAGLLREIAIEGSKAYFDTNTSNHNHFLIESEGRLIDIPGPCVCVERLPAPPQGMRISHIVVVIRLVPKRPLDRGICARSPDDLDSIDPPELLLLDIAADLADHDEAPRAVAPADI